MGPGGGISDLEHPDTKKKKKKRDLGVSRAGLLAWDTLWPDTLHLISVRYRLVTSL